MRLRLKSQYQDALRLNKVSANKKLSDNIPDSAASKNKFSLNQRELKRIYRSLLLLNEYTSEIDALAKKIRTHIKEEE